MIKYNGIASKYFYNMQNVEEIIELIETGNYYNNFNCTQENVSKVINAINKFLSTIKEVKENAVLERYETEEEARAYFGPEFIHQFDQLLTTLDKQQTIVSLHGTNVDACMKICDSGLQYELPNLNSTAVQQSMEYGQKDIHYKNYEGLLNWRHKNYKGLVIVAVPYECYYKEGLWNHFQDTHSSAYGGQDYRIDPDFIVGYLDVVHKKIVLNPKYSRQHHYDNYVKDNQLFMENKDMNNAKLAQVMIDFDKERPKDFVSEDSIKDSNETIDVEMIPGLIENLTGTFNSIKFENSDYMSENKYKHILELLLPVLTRLKKALPLLKTQEQVENEEQDKFSVFDQVFDTDESSIEELPSEESFEDDMDWDSFLPEDDSVSVRK